MDIRKIAIVIVIAILFSILVQATIEAIYPSPRYEDFCKGMYDRPAPVAAVKEAKECPDTYVPPSQEEIDACDGKEGFPDYNYDEYGCPTKYTCNTCQKELDDSMKGYNLIVFIISSILGLIAIFAGVYLPTHKNALNEWVGTGFMLGGIISVFIGTARYYSDMARIVRPIILLIELIIIIWLAYKKLNKNLR